MLSPRWLPLGPCALVLAAIAFLQWRYSLAAIVRDRVRRFLEAIANLVAPFAVMAREMRRMNDLAELALAERLNPKTGERDPVIAITEIPGRNDTEVFWEVEPQAHGKAAMNQALQREWEGQIEAEEEGN